MIRRKLDRHDVEKEPFRVWNAYINLLSNENLEDLTFVQEPAWLVFRYESSVQNGGHFQYFTNCGVELVDQTLDALGLLGASDFQGILKAACDNFSGKQRER